VSTALNVLAVLFAGRGRMNLLEALRHGSGLVFFGHLLPPDTLLAPLVGARDGPLRVGLWTARRWAIPLGVAYARLRDGQPAAVPVYNVMPERIRCGRTRSTSLAALRSRGLRVAAAAGTRVRR
jgi:hypothetical protein